MVFQGPGAAGSECRGQVAALLEPSKSPTGHAAAAVKHGKLTAQACATEAVVSDATVDPGVQHSCHDVWYSQEKIGTKFVLHQ